MSRASRRFIRPLLLAALLLLSLSAGAPASAQPAASPVADERIEALIGTLKDEAARQRLIRDLELLLDAQRRSSGAKQDTLGASLLAALSERVNAVTAQMGKAVAFLHALPNLIHEFWALTRTGSLDYGWIEVLAKIAAALAAGLLAELLAARMLRQPRAALEARATGRVWMRLLFLLARTLLDLVPILAFAAASYAVLPALRPDAATRLIALAVINANLLVRAALALVRMLLSPAVPALRLLPASDEAANFAYVWVRRLAIVSVYGYFAAEAARVLGLSRDAHAMLLKGLGLFVAAMLVVLILQVRQSVADLLRGNGTGGHPALRRLRARLADVWHVVAIVYVAAVFAVLLLNVQGGFAFLLRATLLTVLLLVLARIAAALLVRSVNRLFDLSDEIRARYPLLEARANRYVPLLHRLIRGTVALIALLMLLDTWGVQTFDWLASPAGRRLTGAVLSIALILGAAVLAWEVLNALIERFLRRHQALGGPANGARTATLLPLLRNVVRIVLLVTTVLVVLGQLDIDTGPLLAGAGVVGLAIGFGAQALVKDVITGVFILVEDTLAVGDIVAIGEHAGTVESMSIRTVRVRDLAGDVHIIPFSDVSTIINRSREFSYAVLDVGIAYRDDVEAVIALLQEEAEALRADPTVGPDIVEPLNVMGLEAFGTSALVVRVRLKTRPGKQFAVKRAYNLRIKRAFDARGIGIPFPHQTIFWAGDKESKPRTKPPHVEADAPPARRAAAEPAAT